MQSEQEEKERRTFRKNASTKGVMRSEDSSEHVKRCTEKRMAGIPLPNDKSGLRGKPQGGGGSCKGIGQWHR